MFLRHHSLLKKTARKYLLNIVRFPQTEIQNKHKLLQTTQQFLFWKIQSAHLPAHRTNAPVWFPQSPTHKRYVKTTCTLNKKLLLIISTQLPLFSTDNVHIYAFHEVRLRRDGGRGMRSLVSSLFRRSWGRFVCDVEVMWRAESV